MVRKRLISWMVGVAALLALLCAPCRADGPSREYLVKAAFLYNFAQFVTWPPDAFPSDDAPFIIAEVGDDPFNGALDQVMSGKSVANHPIVVKHFASASDLGPCQLLFVPASQDGALAQILAKTKNQPILTVGESDDFTQGGGAMRFYIDDDRIRFEVDPDVVGTARLKVSAKLMALARIAKH